MRKRIKITTFILSAITVAALGSMTAYANNYPDSPYNFTFNTASNQTAFRPKQDDSSSYMRCEYAQRAYTAHVISRSTQTGANVDCSYGHTYQFNTGSKHFMINSVWETGYREGAIYATRNFGYSYNANGQWSPDSIPE